MIPIPKEKEKRKVYREYCQTRMEQRSCLAADADDPANIFLLIKHKNFIELQCTPFLDHDERIIINPEEHKNDYSGKFHRYYTPVNYAVYLGDIPLVELLCVRGASLDEGALNVAIQQEDIGMIEYLLSKNTINVHKKIPTDIASRLKITKTPFEEALDQHNIDIIDILDIYDSKIKRERGLSDSCDHYESDENSECSDDSFESAESSLSKSLDKIVNLFRKMTP